MPPWAGQGMQSGIRDAANVAWKLREVLAGRLDESVLDTYEAERAPNVAMMTELSKKLGQLIATRDPALVRLRNTLGPVLNHVPQVRDAMGTAPAPSLPSGWLTGQLARRSLVGAMLPQPAMFTAAGHAVRLDDVLGVGFAVLGCDVDPRSVMTPAEAADWESLGARFVAVRPASGAATGDDDLIDRTGRLFAWMSRGRARVVAVRPDRFVAATDLSGLAPPSPVRSSGPAIPAEANLSAATERLGDRSSAHAPHGMRALDAGLQLSRRAPWRWPGRRRA